MQIDGGHGLVISWWRNSSKATSMNSLKSSRVTKKMKQRSRKPGTGVSSSHSNISRAMRGRIQKIPIFPANRNQRNEEKAALTSELILPLQSALSLALQQNVPAASTSQGKRTSDCNHRSPSYIGFDNSSSDSTITAPSKHPRRKRDGENFQLPPAPFVETVRDIATQQPEETNISPAIGEVSPQPSRALINRPADPHFRGRREVEAENLEMDELFISMS